MLKAMSLIAVAAVGLAACSGPESQLDGDLNIGGTEPAFWGVEVRRAEGKSKISIVGEPAFEGQLPVKTRGAEGSFMMTSATSQGDFAMMFTPKECFDGLAESARPWTVSVEWKGEILQGCAEPIGAG